MRRIDLLSGITWCLIFTLSCSSGNSHAPEVHFVHPKLHAQHDLKSDLIIEIDISDDQLVERYTMWLESDAGFDYFRDNKVVQKPNYKIVYRFNLWNNLQTDFSICLEVEDNDGNLTYKSHHISTL